MEYQFSGELIKEGNRVFIPIPFNVWEVCNKKGMISTKVSIDDISFECKLIPKGNGVYYIPVKKKISEIINTTNNISVSFEIISQLTRINKNSPYSKENPIRRIDKIESLIQPRGGLCGQTCVAMLAGVSVDEVVSVMKADQWQGSMSKIIETLDYYGIAHANKMVYMKSKNKNLPQCCIMNTRSVEGNHLVLYYKGIYYDSCLGELEEINLDKVIGFLEIIVD